MRGMASLKVRAGATAPTAEQTFDNLGQVQGSEESRDKAAGRVLQQNIRVAPWAKKRLKQLKSAERATFGELLEAMMAAYEAAGGGLRPEHAPVEDARKGRLHKIEFWGTEGLFKAISRVAAERGLSVSSLQEEWLAKEIQALDPHGTGKFGVLVKRR
jgi:hypothetical protein